MSDETLGTLLWGALLGLVLLGLLWKLARRTRPRQRTETAPAPPGTLDDWRNGLRTLWRGDPVQVEFTYEGRNGARKRRKVAVDEVVRDHKGCVFLQGYCHTAGDRRTFDVEGIVTMMQSGSRRMDLDDWLDQITDGKAYD